MLLTFLCHRHQNFYQCLLGTTKKEENAQVTAGIVSIVSTLILQGRPGSAGGRRFVSENKTSQKNFQILVLHNGGLNLVFQTFFDLNFPENSLIFNTFRNSGIPGPPVRKLGSLFLLFFGGVLHPPHSPPPVVPALTFCFPLSS